MNQLREWCQNLARNPMSPFAMFFAAVWWLFPNSFGFYNFTNDFYNVTLADDKVMQTATGNATWELIGYHAILGLVFTFIILWTGTFTRAKSS